MHNKCLVIPNHFHSLLIDSALLFDSDFDPLCVGDGTTTVFFTAVGLVYELLFGDNSSLELEFSSLARLFTATVPGPNPKSLDI